MPRKDFARRTWLNAQQDRLAFVSTYTTENAEGEFHNVCGHVTIADCSRQVTLDFDVYGGKEVSADDRALAENNLEKLDTLIEELREFRRQYVLRLRSKGLVK